MSKKSKSPEIIRLKKLFDALKLSTDQVADLTGVAKRTIENYLWNDVQIGGTLLRQLHNNYDASIDWLLTGQGSMFTHDSNKNHTNNPLMPNFETTDLNNLQDYWWLAAKAAEQSMIQSGAIPGEDYSVFDLYKISQPIVTEQFKKQGLDVAVYGN